MLNYFNPQFNEWMYSGGFWSWMIWGHVMFILVPGFVAMVVEPPRLFGRGRRYQHYDNVTPIRPPRGEEDERRLRAA